MKSGWRLLQKVLSLFSKTERKKLYWVALAAVCMSVLEFMGVVSVLPFMTVAANPQSVHTNKHLSWLYQMAGLSTEREFLLLLGVFAFLALVVGNSVRSLSSYLLLRFANMQNHHLSRRIFENYLHQPYAYFLSKNSADLSRNVLSEVHQVVNGVFVPLITSFGRVCVVFLIILMLIVVDPILALSVSFVLGGAYLVIYVIFKKRIRESGKERSRAQKLRSRLVSEAFGAVKDIKLMNKESVYLRDFDVPSKMYARSKIYIAVMGEIPRHILETVAFGGILGVLMYFINMSSPAEAIAVTSLYAFAGYKLIPALQQVFNSATEIRFNAIVLDSLYETLYIPVPLPEGLDTKPALPFRNEIRLESITFQYPGTKSPVLQDFNIDIKVNSSLGISGPTGSGKTTLVDILLGLLRPTQGKILIDGVEVTKDNLSSWQKNIGYVPQFIYLSDDTVSSNIAFGVPKKQINFDQVIKSAQLAQIDDFIKTELPHGYNTIVGERGIRLSGGQRQRIGIARALYHDPSLLVFDEATSALDNETEENLMRAVDSIMGKKTIIMIAHRLSTIKKCDHTLNLKKKTNDLGTFLESPNAES